MITPLFSLNHYFVLNSAFSLFCLICLMSTNSLFTFSVILYFDFQLLHIAWFLPQVNASFSPNVQCLQSVTLSCSCLLAFQENSNFAVFFPLHIKTIIRVKCIQQKFHFFWLFLLQGNL